MNLRYLPLLVLPFLTGCLQDTASFMFPEKNHAITLVRNQTWFWQNTVDVDLIAIRLPDCNGGLTVKGLPEDSQYTLYKAPDEYPEPLHLVKTGKRVFALSTQSCRVQEFQETPPDLGEKLGVFEVKGGTFQYVPGGAAQGAKE
jgi:hypothetical protein